MFRLRIVLIGSLLILLASGMAFAGGGSEGSGGSGNQPSTVTSNSSTETGPWLYGGKDENFSTMNITSTYTATISQNVSISGSAGLDVGAIEAKIGRKQGETLTLSKTITYTIPPMRYVQAKYQAVITRVNYYRDGSSVGSARYLTGMNTSTQSGSVVY